MEIIKKLLWGVTTREGRDEFFGMSKANRDFYARGSRMFEKFESNYPEVEIFGQMDNFKGAYQWSDENGYYCYCIPGSESFQETKNYIDVRSNGRRLYYWMRGEFDTEIPLLLPDYRPCFAHVESYAVGLNVVLAKYWLIKWLPESLPEDWGARSSVPSPGVREWFQMQAKLYFEGETSLANKPDIWEDFNSYGLLLHVSQILLLSGAESVIQELPFRPIRVVDLIKSGDFKNCDWQVEYWKKICFKRFRVAFGDDDTLFNLT